MRCRPWRWLWGLLPLALIVFLAVIGERNRVEQDLAVRAEQALQRDGFGWAQPKFEGRDGVLEGTAPKPEDRARAMDTVRRLDGVRVLRDGMDVRVAITPYLWSAQRTDQAIELRGFAPNRALRSKILRTATEQFPNAQLTDKMEYGRGAPDADVWTDGIGFALRQLRELQNGTVGLTDTTLVVEGQARTPQSYRRVAAALRDDMPNGLKRGQHNVKPPVVAPYEWSFDRLGGVIAFGGYVPDDATRQRLLERARKAYPQAEISDRMLVAGGAPDGFADMALVAVDETADLKEVRVATRDTSLSVTGLAETAERAVQVKERLEQSAGRYQVAGKVRAPEVKLPLADPFEWMAQSDGETIVLKGHVPSAALRGEIVKEAKQLYPDAVIDDRMTLASGVPDEKVWMNTVKFGLDELGGLDSGEVSTRGLVLSVRGDVETVGMSRDVRQAFKTAPEGIEIGTVEVTGGTRDLMAEVRAKAAEAEEARRVAAAKAEEAKRIRKAQDEAERKRLAEVQEAERKAARLALRKKYRLVTEYNGTPVELWKARETASQKGNALTAADIATFDDQSTRSRGKLLLRGQVASDEDRAAIVQSAQSLFDGPVSDELEVLDGAPDPTWLNAATAGLQQLSRLRTGALVVTHDDLQLFGDAVTGDAAAAVRRDIDSEAPGRFDVSFLISAPKALQKTEVETALKTVESVEADQCGNLMNSLTSLAPIRFDVASARIRPAALPTLDKLSLVAQKCPNTRIRVSGHTDSKGTKKYNQKLSEERAAAVVSYLTARGVDRSRFSARGLGETQPLVKNKSPKQRALNRRIEFTVTEQ